MVYLFQNITAYRGGLPWYNFIRIARGGGRHGHPLVYHATMSGAHATYETNKKNSAQKIQIRHSGNEGPNMSRALVCYL